MEIFMQVSEGLRIIFKCFSKCAALLSSTRQVALKINEPFTDQKKKADFWSVSVRLVRNLTQAAICEC